MCEDWEKVDEQSPLLPLVVLIAPEPQKLSRILARIFLHGKCHDSMAGTGAVCLTACTRAKGSVANQMLSIRSLEKDRLDIVHPLSIFSVVVQMNKEGTADTSALVFETLSLIRTAR